MFFKKNYYNFSNLDFAYYELLSLIFCSTNNACLVVPLIAGAGGGGVALLLIILLTVVCIKRREKKYSTAGEILSQNDVVTENNTPSKLLFTAKVFPFNHSNGAD